jgi:acetate kinase
MQVACFDTAFHLGTAPSPIVNAIPERFHVEGARRYGFHGLSYECVAKRLRQVAPAVASKRVIIAHLGSVASMGALIKGLNFESTMGFTALDGLPMGTRPEQIDSGVLCYLINIKGMPATSVEGLKWAQRLVGDQQRHAELQSSHEPPERCLPSSILSIHRCECRDFGGGDRRR